MMNKRGIELTIGTLIVIILGLIVSVFLIYGFTVGFDFFFGKFEKLPGQDLEAVAQSCRIAATGNLRIDYCSFKEVNVDGKKEFVYCNDPRIQFDIGDDIEKLDCNTDSNFAEFDKICRDELGGDWSKENLDCEGSKEFYRFEGIPCCSSILGNVEKTEEETESDLVFLWNPSGNKIKEEDCKGTIDERKERLGIPDKICYWETLTELYANICKLHVLQVSEIFENKAEYRRIQNPDWPNLNTDGDYCVPVIYDCDEWKKFQKLNIYSAGGFYHFEFKNIQINPYLDMSPEYIQNRVLLHEGLHSVQGKLVTDTHLGDGENFGTVFGSYKKQRGHAENTLQLLDVWEKMDPHIKIINDAISKDEADFIAAYEMSQFVSSIKISIIYGESINEYENKIINYLTQKNKYDDTMKTALANLLVLNKDAVRLQIEYPTKGYVGSKIEIDPRLSEVARWWLDQTEPDCQIISTKEKAREVLNAFLAEKNLPASYIETQIEFKRLLFIYEGTKYEQEVYDNLVNRLPGLAGYDTNGDDFSGVA